MGCLLRCWPLHLLLGFLQVPTFSSQSLQQPMVTLIDISSSSATFSVIEASNSLPAEQFIITLIKTADSTCAIEAHVRTGSSNSSIVTVEGLREHTTYSVRVMSISSNTTREDSNLFLITTLTAVPSASPSNLRHTSIASRSVTLEWSAITCEDRNGLIFSYDIQYVPAGGTLILTNTGTSATQYTVSGLVPYTSYSFSVAGVTVNGTGPFSTFIGPLTTSEDANPVNKVPGPVSGLIGTTTYFTVDLIWSPPDIRNGIILSYIIQYRVNESPKVVMDTVTSLSEPQNYTISGLAPGTVVSDITLRATTGAGTGTSVTFDSTFTTFRQPPVVPNIEVQILADNIVRVSWDRVQDSMVTEYLVYYSPSGRSASEALRIAPSSNNFTDIIGLNAESYTFEVVAQSVLGQVLQSNRSAAMMLNIASSATPDVTSATPDVTSATPDVTSATPDVTSATPDATYMTSDVTSATFASSDMTYTTTSSTQESNDEILPLSSNTTDIVVTAIVVFIVTIILYSVILAIVLVIIYSRRSSKQTLISQQSPANQMTFQNVKNEKSMDENATYEVIPNKYEAPAEGLEMSHCVAYGQVANTNGRPISRRLTPSITMPGGTYEDYTDD